MLPPSVKPSTIHKCWIKEDGQGSLVSVIVPTYNRCEYLTETLNSIYFQRYRPIEVIVIDDGSTDETPSLMQEWADDHSADRFQVHYEQQPNRGAPAARNLGAIRSSGSFLQFLDSDDKLHPCKIKSQVELLQKNPEVGFVYCLSSRFCRDQDHSSISGFDFERGGIAKMLRQNMCQTSAALYRRRVCRDAGPWDEDLRGGQDWEYSHRAILASDRKVLFQPEVYNFIRSNDSEERITKQGSQFVEQRFKALQKVHRLHAIRGALSRYIVQKSFALSYAQMAFLLHDFDVDRSSVQTALRLSLQTAPMFLKPVFLIPFYIYWLIPEGFSLAKRFVRMIR